MTSFRVYNKIVSLFCLLFRCVVHSDPQQDTKEENGNVVCHPDNIQEKDSTDANQNDKPSADKDEPNIDQPDESEISTNGESKYVSTQDDETVFDSAL